MAYTDLLWQLPAIFAAVPMAHRLLPFAVPARARPLMYFVVSLVVMLMPGRVDLALGAAGLISMLHIRLGENPAHVAPPDMKEVANKLALGWDYLVKKTTSAIRLPVTSKEIIVDDGSGDVNEAYQEPPPPPEHQIRQHIPHLD